MHSEGIARRAAPRVGPRAVGDDGAAQQQRVERACVRGNGGARPGQRAASAQIRRARSRAREESRRTRSAASGPLSSAGATARTSATRPRACHSSTGSSVAPTRRARNARLPFACVAHRPAAPETRKNAG